MRAEVEKKGRTKIRMDSQAVLVDTHAHYNDMIFVRDVPDLRQRAQQAGVAVVVCVGYEVPSSRRAVMLAQKYPDVYATVGVHPHDTEGMTPRAWEALRLLAGEERVVALGEMGLDFYRNFSPHQVQEQVFRQQLDLALELHMPVVIHDRDAHDETMEILKEFPGLAGVVMHCFSGGRQMTEECLAMGFYLGIGGPLTYPKSHALVDVARTAPLDRILLETDCPYLSPQPWRGERNEPSYLPVVAEKLAELRGISRQEVAAATTANALRFYNISLPASGI
jgi:TatD DNase family protein